MAPARKQKFYTDFTVEKAMETRLSDAKAYDPKNDAQKVDACKNSQCFSCKVSLH